MRRTPSMLPMALFAAVLVLGANERARGAEPADKPVKGGVPGTNVDMPFLIAPMTGADGNLNGYAYISSRLTASSATAALDVREKIPFIQDSFVRDVNATAVVTAADIEKIDIPGVEARLLADARKVVGMEKVKVITLCTIQISALHPKQAATPDVPADHLPPGAPAPKNPVKSRCDS